jgi:hypothetical protein
MPFSYYGKRSAGICVALGGKNPHVFPREGTRFGALGVGGCNEYTSGFLNLRPRIYQHLFSSQRGLFGQTLGNDETGIALF